MAIVSTSKTVVESFSLGASYDSPAIDVRQSRSTYVVVVVTGASALTGTLSIEASPNGVDGWAQLGALSAALTGDITQAFDITTTGAPYIRVKWLRTGGTATGRIDCSVKMEL